MNVRANDSSWSNTRCTAWFADVSAMILWNLASAGVMPAWSCSSSQDTISS
jgi:hypothetical protein